ncbi:hypothetical protein [Rhizobacter sp. P5_C2]
MSVAGTRSNRGDLYQVVVALREAVLVLSDPNRAWLELDSTMLMADGTPISVDDVVVGYQDGRMECIQCKKNQADFKNWTVTDLADELVKAAKLVAVEPSATVRFYSRGDFGSLAKLREKASETGNEGAFLLNVGKELQSTYQSLVDLLANVANAPTAFHFLQRVRFTPTREIEDVREEARVLLRAIVTREPDAFNALWRCFDEAAGKVGDGATMPAKSRFRKSDLIALLGASGCALGASKALVDIERELCALSSIGRQWPRDIGGLHFDREAVSKLLNCIDGKATTVLLTDGPGAGKTCVLLSLLDELEKRADIVPVFVQAREFAESGSLHGRVELGFPKDLFSLVSGASEHKRVVVVIDSLDVLSLARETESLKFFLALVDRLALVPDITIVAACRSFDLQYNHKLKSRKWAAKVEVGLLDWDSAVRPTLEGWGIDCDRLDANTRGLLPNPRNLALYREVVERGGRSNAVSAQDLTEHYLDAVVLSEERLGDSAMEGIEAIATTMLMKRRLDVDRRSIKLGDETVQALLSARVLFSGRAGWCGFGHQTLPDALAVRGARRRGLSLAEFIRALPAVPFVRPAVRAFFSHLRSSDVKDFRIQMRAAFDSEVAFHLKRLLAESFSEVEPEEEDWNLVRYLYRSHDHLFRALYSSVRSVKWFHFLHGHLVPIWEAERNVDWLQIHIRRVGAWLQEEEDAVITFWEKAARSDWFDANARRRLIGLQLHGAQPRNWWRLLPLLDALCRLPFETYDFVGHALEKVISATGSGDEVLWNYLTQDVTDDAIRAYKFDTAIRIENSFEKNEFLLGCFKRSEWLLDQGVEALERWSHVLSRDKTHPQGEPISWNQEFLEHTSYEEPRSVDDLRHRSSGNIFVSAVEFAILHHAASRSDWWRRNGMHICLNPCGGLRYMGAVALIRHPQGNEAIARAVLTRTDLYFDFDSFELGSLIRASAYMVPDVAESVELGICRRIERYGDADKEYVKREKFDLLDSIPAPLRSEEVVRALARLGNELGPPNRSPKIRSWSGWVKPPLLAVELMVLSDRAFLLLLRGAQELGWNRIGYDLTGGLSALVGQVQTAATKQPARFMALLTNDWGELDARYQAAIFEGVARYLQQVRGNLQQQQDSIPTEDTDTDQLALQVLQELERHEFRWRGTRVGMAALQGCAHCLAQDDELATRMVFWAVGSVDADDPASVRVAETDLESLGLNCARGELADSLMVIGTKRLEEGLALPAILMPLLVRLSVDPHPAVRAMVLRRLAYFISKFPEGWRLLENIVDCDDARIWKSAERCIYYFCAERFEDVKPMLDAMKATGAAPALKSWARLSALATLSWRIDISVLSAELKQLANEGAWSGACMVWFANSRRADLFDTCMVGLMAAMDDDVGASQALSGMSRLFREDEDGPAIPIPISFLQRALERANEIKHQGGFHGLEKWCFRLADSDPAQALEVAEVLAQFSGVQGFSYDGPEALPGLLTSLFREAEEQEVTDRGEMLRRVIALQDQLLQSSHESLLQWLKAAERLES